MILTFTKGSLPCLKTLQMSHNKVSQMSDVIHLKECPSLSVVDLSHNQIEDPAVLDVFAAMISLRVLNMSGNPVLRHMKNYRKNFIVGIKNICYLDDRPVTDKERACVMAWSLGGIEAERKERLRWKEMEQEKIQRSVRAVLAMKNGKTEMQLLVEEEVRQKLSTSTPQVENKASNYICKTAEVASSEKLFTRSIDFRPENDNSEDSMEVRKSGEKTAEILPPGSSNESSEIRPDAETKVNALPERTDGKGNAVERKGEERISPGESPLNEKQQNKDLVRENNDGAFLDGKMPMMDCSSDRLSSNGVNRMASRSNDGDKDDIMQSRKSITKVRTLENCIKTSNSVSVTPKPFDSGTDGETNSAPTYNGAKDDSITSVIAGEENTVKRSELCTGKILQTRDVAFLDSLETTYDQYFKEDPSPNESTKMDVAFLDSLETTYDQYFKEGPSPNESTKMDVFAELVEIFKAPDTNEARGLNGAENGEVADVTCEALTPDTENKKEIAVSTETTKVNDTLRRSFEVRDTGESQKINGAKNGEEVYMSRETSNAVTNETLEIAETVESEKTNEMLKRNDCLLMTKENIDKNKKYMTNKSKNQKTEDEIRAASPVASHEANRNTTESDSSRNTHDDDSVFMTEIHVTKGKIISVSEIRQLPDSSDIGYLKEWANEQDVPVIDKELDIGRNLPVAMQKSTNGDCPGASGLLEKHDNSERLRDQDKNNNRCKQNLTEERITESISGINFAQPVEKTESGHSDRVDALITKKKVTGLQEIAFNESVQSKMKAFFSDKREAAKPSDGSPFDSEWVYVVPMMYENSSCSTNASRTCLELNKEICTSGHKALPDSSATESEIEIHLSRRVDCGNVLDDLLSSPNVDQKNNCEIGRGFADLTDRLEAADRDLQERERAEITSPPSIENSAHSDGESVFRFSHENNGSTTNTPLPCFELNKKISTCEHEIPPERELEIGWYHGVDCSSPLGDSASSPNVNQKEEYEIGRDFADLIDLQEGFDRDLQGEKCTVGWLSEVFPKTSSPRYQTEEHVLSSEEDLQNLAFRILEEETKAGEEEYETEICVLEEQNSDLPQNFDRFVNLERDYNLNESIVETCLTDDEKCLKNRNEDSQYSRESSEIQRLSSEIVSTERWVGEYNIEMRANSSSGKPNSPDISMDPLKIDIQKSDSRNQSDNIELFHPPTEVKVRQRIFGEGKNIPHTPSTCKMLDLGLQQNDCDIEDRTEVPGAFLHEPLFTQRVMKEKSRHSENLLIEEIEN